MQRRHFIAASALGLASIPSAWASDWPSRTLPRWSVARVLTSLTPGGTAISSRARPRGSVTTGPKRADSACTTTETDGSERMSTVG